MSDLAGVDELLERLSRGELPAPARLAAARGALPLPAAELVRLQVYLALHDGDEEVQRTAAAGLTSLDPGEASALMSSPDLAAEVAEFFAARPDAAPPILEALARNVACPDEAVAGFASRATAEVVDALVANQVRLIRSPQVLEALESNSALTAGQRDRLAEVRKHFLEPPSDAEPLVPTEAARMGEAILAAEKEQGRLELEATQGEEIEPEPDGDAPEAGPDGDETVSDDSRLPAFQKIMQLSVGERVKLAFCGTSEERVILVRDGNRVVAESVLKSPKVNEKEVERFVKMRSLSENVMRVIAANREWTRNYAVTVGLVRNPKTAAKAALALMQRVNIRDLKSLAGDRNIPEVVRQHARKRFTARTQGSKGRRG